MTGMRTADQQFPTPAESLVIYCHANITFVHCQCLSTVKVGLWFRHLSHQVSFSDKKQWRL